MRTIPFNELIDAINQVPTGLDSPLLYVYTYPYMIEATDLPPQQNHSLIGSKVRCDERRILPAAILS
jgi:hypothetical protein